MTEDEIVEAQQWTQAGVAYREATRVLADAERLYRKAKFLMIQQVVVLLLLTGVFLIEIWKFGAPPSWSAFFALGAWSGTGITILGTWMWARRRRSAPQR